jgi:sulfatase maturation enzyme AslB (radical SAM superfamily)
MGGEVFLLPNVEDLVYTWTSVGIRVSVVTNGILQQRIAAFVRRFPDVTMNLSVDGIGSASAAQRGYDAIRVLESLLARCNPRFNLILTVVDQNVEEIASLLEHPVADAAESIFVNLDNRVTMTALGRTEKVHRALRPTAQKAAVGLLEEMQKCRNALKIVSTIDRRFVVDGGVRCGNAVDGGIRIGPEGKAYLCERLSEECGHILKDSPERILTRLRENEARLRELTFGRMLPICTNCCKLVSA